MAELIACNACGVKNAPDRTVCFRCGAGLDLDLEPIAPSSIQQLMARARHLPEMDLNKLLKISLVLGVLLVSSSIFYYFSIFAPQKERTQLELQRQQETARLEIQRREVEAREDKEIRVKIAEDQEKQEAEIRAERKDATDKALLGICLTNTWENYRANWASSCKAEHQKWISAIVSCNQQPDRRNANACMQIILATLKQPDGSPECTLDAEIASRLGNERKRQEYDCLNKHRDK